MIPLHRLCLSIEEAIEFFWPGQTVVVQFEPLLDLHLGDVGSDVCLRLAELLRKDPIEIRDRICQALPEIESLQIFPRHQFINVLFEETLLASGCPLPLELYRSERIAILVDCDERAIGMSRYRLLARALLHGLFCVAYGGRATLYFEDISCLIETGKWSVLRDFWNQAAIRVPGKSQPEIEEFDTGFIHTLSGTIQETRFPSSILDRSIIVGANPEWWNFPTEMLSVPECRSPESFASTLFYLAGYRALDELDLAVPFLHEQENLLWYFFSLSNKLEALFASMDFENSETATGLSPEERGLLTRARFLEHFFVGFTWTGDFFDSSTVLSDFCSRVSSWLASPERRERVHSNTCLPADLLLARACLESCGRMKQRLSVFGIS